MPEAEAHAPILVVQIWAAWDGHSRRMDDLLKALSLQFRDQVEFRSMDVDDEENFDFLARLGLAGTPALLVLARSKAPAIFYGIRTEPELRRMLRDSVKDWERLSSQV